ncbi:MAG: hypothetical protein Q7S75_01210 [bacterium]|nr:hypothetical protein [bacterium]
MNTNTGVIAGIVGLVAVVGVIFYVTQSNTPSTDTTSNPSTTNTGDTTQNTTPTQSQAGVPRATTDSNAAPTDTTAVVTGTVNADGALTNYWYEYGTTANLGNKSPNQIIGSSYSNVPSPGYITGLVKDTNYYFRLVAQNEFGTAAGAEYSFRTTTNTPAPVGSAPTTKTLAANSITRTTANISADVTPNKAATQYWFEYGQNGQLGNTTAFISIGNGSVSVPVSTIISNLDPATTYYYRVNAQNQFGTSNGAILIFKTTGPAASVVPVVTTQVANSVTKTSATVRGTVNPSGAQTNYWFEYSTDSVFGSVLLKTTSQKSAGGGTNTVSVGANLSSLKSATTYYYRIVAQNSAGIVRGNSLFFKTN